MVFAALPTISEACYKLLYKSHKKIVHNSHLSFLNSCLRNGLSPKGLTIKTAPTIENTDPGCHGPCGTTSSGKSSSLLMQILKRYHCSEQDRLQDDIDCLERALHRWNDFASNKDTISRAVAHARGELEQQKKRKLNFLLRTRPTHHRKLNSWAWHALAGPIPTPSPLIPAR